MRSQHPSKNHQLNQNKKHASAEKALRSFFFRCPTFTYPVVQCSTIFHFEGYTSPSPLNAAVQSMNLKMCLKASTNYIYIHSTAIILKLKTRISARRILGPSSPARGLLYSQFSFYFPADLQLLNK